eukprot:gene12444-12581_t
MGASGLNQVMATTWSLLQLPRSAFDDTKGILAVEELTSRGEQGTAAAVGYSDKLRKSHYLGFGAAGALLQYVRQNMGLTIAPRALRPLTDINTLQLRLDSLQELLESPHLALELASMMQTLPKQLDKVCSNLAVRPSSAAAIKDPSARMGSLVSAVILLRDVLRCLPAMADSMTWVDTTLLKAVQANLGQEKLRQLLQEIEAVMDDDAQASKAQFVNKVQQCFAVRTQVDSFLDMSRATFTRLTESIHDLAAKYSSSTGITTLKMQYSAAKGFFIVVPDASALSAKACSTGLASQLRDQQAAPHQLPKSFLVLEKRGRNSTCVTTHELNALNSRLRDAAADCMLLTIQVLEKLVDQLLSHMSLLQQMLDNVSLLDMLLSLFHAVGGADGDWVRPQLYDSGPLAITGGRHPLLQAIRGTSFDCKPNDTYLSPSCTQNIITGPNMSGKSTYLKQVALLVVMAQIGCYVPATHMSLTVSSRSLVMIDELGRATSTADGVGLCWAFSEYMLAVGCHVLLATHFRQLEDLATLYPSCKLWRMQVDISDGDLSYKWTVVAADEYSQQPGDTGSAHYGVVLARMAGLPSHIIAKATKAGCPSGVAAAVVVEKRDGDDASSDACVAALRECLPILDVLKQQAEQLLLAINT